MNALQCPKCGSPMRSYERNSIHVDQCTGCRGVFLDAGELEHLVNAEQQWYVPAQQPQAAAAPPPPPQHQPQYQQQQQHHGYHQPHGYRPDHYRGYKHKKRKSFLSEILDFD